MASRSWNRVELIGNLTRDPELRYTPNGAAVCTFGLATNRTYVSEGERKEEADFHRLVSWNKLAELCNQLLKKGHRVFVSGRLQTRSWEGQDGQVRQVTEIVIEDMILLSPKTTTEAAVVGEELGVEELPKEELASRQPEVEEQVASEAQVSSKETAPSSQKGAKETQEKPKSTTPKPARPAGGASEEDVVDDKDLPF